MGVPANAMAPAAVTTLTPAPASCAALTAPASSATAKYTAWEAPPPFTRSQCCPALVPAGTVTWAE